MATHIYDLCRCGMLPHLCYKYGARILRICKSPLPRSFSEDPALKHEDEEHEHKREDYMGLYSICDTIFD